MNDEYSEEDMANVGRALMTAIEIYADSDWHPNDCPSEIVGDLRNERDEWKQQHENLLSVKEQDNKNLMAQIDQLQAHIDVLQEKEQSDCACGYDRPNDVCMFHRKMIDKAMEDLTKERDALLEENKWLGIESAPNEGDFLVFMPNERIKIQTARNNGKGVLIIGNAFAFDLTKPTHWMRNPKHPDTSKEVAK